MLTAIRAHHRPFLADMMSCLTVDELEILTSLLTKIEHKVDNDDCP